MKKLILIAAMVGLTLPANALSAYNWQDYYLNPEGGDRVPLILPIMPTPTCSSNSNRGWSVPQPVQILGNPTPGSHIKILSPQGTSDGYLDGSGHLEIK